MFCNLFVASVVDANGAVGTKCTIDVVKNDSGKQVPYISYQLIGGVATYNAKVAYRTDFSQDNFAGADEKDFYTGKWEISVVPTSSLKSAAAFIFIAVS